MLREENKVAKLLEIAVWKVYIRSYNFGKLNIYITGKIVAQFKYLVFELLSFLLNTPSDILHWIKLTGIINKEKRKTYILLNQHEIEIQRKNCDIF